MYIVWMYFCWSILILSTHLCEDNIKILLLSSLFRSGCPTKWCMHFSSLPYIMHASLILFLGWITQGIFEEYKSWSSLLRSLVPPVPSSHVKYTVMHHIMMFRSTTDRIYDGGKNFLETLDKLIVEEKYLPDQIFNMDETSLFWKRMPERTFIHKEAKVNVRFQGLCKYTLWHSHNVRIA